MAQRPHVDLCGPEFDNLDALSSEVFQAFMKTLHLHRQMMVRTLADKGNHMGVVGCLRTLARNDGISQRDLADALHVSRPRVTTMLQAMERDGLITREPDESDQRLTRVRLTAAGRRLDAELRSVLADYIERTIGVMPEGDRRELLRLLDAMSANIAEALGMIRLLRTFLRPYRVQLVFVLALLLAQALFNLYLPALNADIINNGVAKGDIAYILRVGAFMLAVTLVLIVVSVVSVYFGSRTAMAFGRDVRRAIFRRVGAFSQTEVNLFGTPSLITRNTNDVQQVQMVLMMALTLMILAPMMAIGGIVMAVRQDVPLSSLLVVILPLMAGFIGFALVRAMPLFKAMQVKIDRINQVTRETLAGVRVIRAFVRDDFERRRFAAANEDLTQTSLAVGHIFAYMIPSLFGILNLATVAVMWFGSIRIASGAMPIGNLTAFLTYITMILMSVMMATIMFAMVPRAAASAERIQAVLDAEPSVIDPVMPGPTLGTAGHLEFRHVEFRYPGAQDPVLRNISFSAGPGETTAIVGSTGSGKSTVINLIPRFYDVTSGAVLIDGVDVRDMCQADVWARIGLIPQRAFLFTGTVASNLRYGDESASDGDLWHALRVAQGADFVAEMPDQLEARIEQGGMNVSGGQRQRLAIARALVKRPEIYVFDDSFSALDFATDSRLRAALKRETRAATVIIVAQRVSTIMHADRIVVMDAGRVADIGTHDELMERCDTYREIVYSQLTQEEIA